MKKFKSKASKVKTSAEFNELYKKLYDSNIVNLEKTRKKVRLLTIIQIILMIFVGIAYVILDGDSDLLEYEIPRNLVIIGGISFLILIPVLIINHNIKSKYKATYKTEVLSNFFNLINNKLSYFPEYSDGNNLLQNSYKTAQFDNKKHNRCEIDDYIEGNLDENTFAKLCDINLEYESGSGKDKNTTKIFQGIFAITSCNKDIGTYVKISKDKFKFKAKPDLVQLDNQTFEKYFDVYSEDKIFALRILTPDIMELLMDFYTKYELDFEIVFRNENIYLRFFTGAMFEPRVFGNSMDRELIVLYSSILKFILELTKEVNHVLKEIEV